MVRRGGEGRRASVAKAETKACFAAGEGDAQLK